jgi:DNA uptake protein ComE-like DNA-binding protein
MKYWWSRGVKDYLSFTRRERRGVFIIIFVGASILFFAAIFQPKQQKLNKDDFAKDIAQLKISIDTSVAYAKHYNADERDDYFQPKRNDNYNANVKGELFTFDPNTIDAAGWKKLGLRDKTIATIEKFRAKGFKFRKADDIRRVYGLKPDEASRLIPFIHIAGKEESNAIPSANAYASEKKAFTPTSYTSKSSDAFKPKIIDVNEADTSAFISLPGIGSKLAFRIVNFRDKLGGFYSVNQVAETYGVPDSTFQMIKPRLKCSEASLKKININQADINELKSHPYIRYNFGNAIINYRKQHGDYKSVEDIRQINIISEDVFNKISPYLVI